MIQNLALCLLCLTTWFGQHGVPIDFMGVPPPELPTYNFLERAHGVEGTITIFAKFDHRTAQSITLESSNLSGEWDWAVTSLESYMLHKVSFVMKKWKISISSEIERTITFEFRLDRNLAERQRRFTITYGDFGIPSRILIEAAPYQRREPKQGSP